MKSHATKEFVEEAVFLERNKTVSLCMIVKNEEKFLESCLNSIKDIVDEIIIVDTGSIDNTIKIAEKFNAKIINHKWENNFSEARNISLNNASKEWILLMDADDIFDAGDKEKLIQIINKGDKIGYFFKTLSYVSEKNYDDYVYNSNLRLLKNIGEYEFKGAIHEQITHKFEPTDYSKFKTVDIRVYHKGYLPGVAEEKNKRKRNIRIIEEELNKYPNNPFYNFNMANEYFAMNKCEEALKYYNIAYQNMNEKSGYTSKLVMKRVLALIESQKFDIAMRAIDEGIKMLPNFTELYFYKGHVYQKKGQYTLAIKYFSKCIEMGEASIDLRMINGCGSFRSYFALGDIYFELKDYEEAANNYIKSEELGNKRISIYYKLGEALSKLYEDKSKIVNILKNMIDISKISGLLLLSNVLNNCGVYDCALEYLNEARKIENSDRVIFKIAKTLLYKREYDSALNLFNKVPDNSIWKNDSVVNSIIIRMIMNEKIDIEQCDLIKDKVKRVAILVIYYVCTGREIIMITEDTEEVLKEVIEILDTILIIREFDMFEKLLATLNYIESNNVLLELAKLYNKNGFYELAKDEVIRSIKKLNTFDREGLKILYS